MCGICGFLAPGDGPVERDLVAGMCRTIRHRGPDDDGVFVAPGIGLGATRLAIIDVHGGHQPVAGEDGRVVAVLNGEIYNYRALRAELMARGHSFATHGDTEVLVHLYEEMGPAFVERLRGMFALAVWDGQEGLLLLARDRLGIKPLFFHESPSGLLFGSEIKAILAAGVPRALDPMALHDYLSFDFVPGPRTMFEGIRKLPAGCLLVARPGGRTELVRYWDFPNPPESEDGPSRPAQRELEGELTARLTEAVKVTLESDVPVGAFLSGGLDSSVVVALMARVAPGPVRTFSVGFRERSYNELPQAAAIARHFGTDHTEVVLEPRVTEVIERLVDAFDEPFADSSAVAAWYVSSAAASDVKVVLSGDGGDEVFGGYVIYQADRLHSAYRGLPAWLTRRALPRLVERLPSSDRKMSWDLRLRRFVTHAANDPITAHAGWRVVFTDDMKERLYADGFPASRHDSLEGMRRAFEAYPGSDLLNRFLVVDAKVSLVDDMLTKVDRMSMAHGLEVRVPLLDHVLVEWMTCLPSRHKVRGLQLKHLFRRVARTMLPLEVARRPKAGFHVPMPAWLRGDLRPIVEQQLSAEVLGRQGVFDPGYVALLKDEHMSGRRDHSRNLWGLLVFGLWVDRYMGGRV